MRRLGSRLSRGRGESAMVSRATSCARQHESVGDVVDGRYLLTKRAGAGAAGTVWTARDLTRDIDVAVKLLRARHLESAQIVAHFAREAELAARMLSPHIVRVLGSGVTDSHGP